MYAIRFYRLLPPVRSVSELSSDHAPSLPGSVIAEGTWKYINDSDGIL